MGIPKISICIPVYNQASTIANTIESVLSQTVKPFEIIVSENFSDDGTKEIVQGYSDQIKIVQPQEHLKMSDNWNFCAKKCNGNWIGFISGDDFLLPNYIESMQKGILKNAKAVFIMGGWKNLNNDTQITTNRFILSMSNITYPPTTTKMLLSGPKASFAAFCFNKNTFEKIGGFDENYNLIQDWILQFDFSFHGTFIKVNEIVATYTINDRPELEFKRLPLYINDYLLYLNTKIWKANEVGISQSEIMRRGRIVIAQLLNRISTHNYTCSSIELIEIKSVCVKYNSSTIFKKWLKNKNLIQPDNFFQKRLKQYIRNILTYLKVSLNKN
jgi:glycosyltransferase involved in cell wall biosynthesis